MAQYALKVVWNTVAPPSITSTGGVRVNAHTWKHTSTLTYTVAAVTPGSKIKFTESLVPQLGGPPTQQEFSERSGPEVKVVTRPGTYVIRATATKTTQPNPMLPSPESNVTFILEWARVTPPVFSPSGGTHLTSVSVTIS